MFVGPEKDPRYVPGDVLVDDVYSRLYIVLATWWLNHLGRRYRVLVVSDWSGLDQNFSGEIRVWGDGVEDDELVGQIELPAMM